MGYRKTTATIINLEGARLIKNKAMTDRSSVHGVHPKFCTALYLACVAYILKGAKF